jgi:hypothetical protein
VAATYGWNFSSLVVFTSSNGTLNVAVRDENAVNITYNFKDDSQLIRRNFGYTVERNIA